MSCGRVLLLESEDAIREALQDGLEMCGLPCCSASTTDCARALLDSECTPSVIVLDIPYPPEPGLQLFEWVQNEPRLERVPVLVTSSVPLDSLRSVAQKADQVLLKPFELDEFVEIVRDLVPAPGPPALLGPPTPA